MKPLNILAVDDMPLIREMLAHTLRRVGHEVTAAANGREAMACLDQQDFDLIITDVMMPEMDGLELIKVVRIRQPHARILVISGGTDYVAEGGGQYLAKALGANAVLAKPFDTEHLLQAINLACPAQSAIAV